MYSMKLIFILIILCLHIIACMYIISRFICIFSLSIFILNGHFDKVYK